MLMLTDRPADAVRPSLRNGWQQPVSDEAWPQWIRPHLPDVFQAIDHIDPGDVDIIDDNDILQAFFENLPEHVRDVLRAAPPAASDAIIPMVLHRFRS